MKTRSLYLIAVFSACLLIVPLGRGDDTGKKEGAAKNEVMQRKLALAQQLFASLATEDYPAIEQRANQLAELTHEGAWLIHRTPEYRQESTDFEQAAYLLAEAAKKKNLSATTLGFLNVTLSCAQCHNYLRDSKDIQLDQIDVATTFNPPAGQEEASYWMAKKLQLSSNILAGLAVGDCESIAKNAKEMDKLSRIEGWARRTDAKHYRAQLEIFREANADVLRHAEANDVSSATLAFTQLTLSCVKCHRQLRTEREQ